MKVGSPAVISAITGLAAFALISILGAPGLYWGEAAIITARAWRLGGSHPPGYPGFMHFVHCFQTWFPLSDIAFRANMTGWIFLGVFTGLLCNVFLAWNLPVALSMFAALGFSVISGVIQATSVVEVYGLHLTFILLIILLNISEKVSNSSFYLTVFITALALTHHLTFLLFIPGLVIWIYIDRRKKLTWNHLLPAIIFAMLGFSLYVYLPLRDSVAPGSVWGNPSSWKGFVKLVTAFEEAKGSFRSGISQWTSIQMRSKNIISLILQTITVPGLVLLVPGIIGIYRRSKGVSIFLLTSFCALTASVLIYDSRETESFYLPGILFIWIFLVLGLGELPRIFLIKKLKHKRLALNLFTLVPIIFFISNLYQSLPARITDVDVPRKMAQNSLDTFAGNGLIISQRSDWCFLHWYLADIEKRSSSTMVYQPLLSFYWYYETLVEKGLMTPSLTRTYFEDSYSWNSAVTASLVAQNKSRQMVRLADHQVLDDIISGGFEPDELVCSLFGHEIGWNESNTRLLPEPPLFLPGRLDPFSRHAVGALYYNFGICLENIGRLNESRSAFNRAMTYQDHGI